MIPFGVVASQSAAGAAGFSLSAAGGTYAITGGAATLARTWRAAAGGGSYAITGSDATIRQSVYRLTADGGSYAITGSAASFVRTWNVVAAGGSYAITGSAATLTRKDASISSVVLLLGFNGVDAATSTTDESPAPHTMTFNGNAQLDTAQAKFGSASLLLDGTGDFLTTADSAHWDFGAGQFTVEFFVRYNSVTDVEFVSQWDLSATVAGWKFGRTAASGLIFNFYDSGGTLRAISAAWTPSTGQWYHVCTDRDGGGNVRLYVDGTMIGSEVNADTFRNSTKALSIGRIDHSTPRYLNGWLDELRITKGVARYASDGGFTVPQEAFPRS